MEPETTVATPLLELKDVRVRYGGIEAVRGVSLTVGDGELVTLIGGNGAGKTTTLNTVSGIKLPYQGEIHFEGEPIHGLPPHQIVELGVCQSPVGRRIFPRMSVTENLTMGAFGRRGLGRGVDRDHPPHLRRGEQAGGAGDDARLHRRLSPELIRNARPDWGD